jgi:gliding motility-associated-like protein
VNKENKPIEDLFKDAFEHFEKAPNSSVWSGIQSGIKAPASGATAATKGAISIGAKIGIALATVGVITTTLYVGFVNVNEKEIAVAEQKSTNQQHNNLSPIVEEENSATEIIDEDTTTIKSKNDSNADKVELNSITENYKQPKEVSNVDINQSTVNVANNSKQKIQLTTTPAESPNSNATISEGKEINSRQEIADDKISEADQKIAKVLEEKTPLSAIINVNQVNGEIPFQLTFNTPEKADTYTWKLNGLTISNSKSSSIEITATGTQKLELTVTKGEQTAQSIQIIDSKKSTKTTIPNIFTPNQDGMNDVFRIEGDFDQLSVKVLDKNYKELHNWTGQYGFWDGTYPDGSMAPNGVYFYVGSYQKDGKKETLKGSVTLRR